MKTKEQIKSEIKRFEDSIVRLRDSEDYEFKSKAREINIIKSKIYALKWVLNQ